MQLINSTDGLFHDGNQATGAIGTFLAAVWHNAVQAEIAAPILAAGMALDPNNNAQLLAAILALIESKTGNYGLDTGAANAYVTALTPAVGAYTNGLPISFRAANANSGASTINAGPGPVPLLRDDGTAMQQGDIPKGAVVSGIYDTAAAGVLVNSVVASQFDAIIQSGSPIYSVDVGTANNYQVAYFPAITKLTDGMVLRFKAKNVNTGGSTFTPNPGVIPPLPAWGGNHQALQGTELAGEVEVQLNQSLNGGLGAWVVLGNTGGPIQIANATQSQHALALGQFVASLASNGYLKIPVIVGGTVFNVFFQWGAATTTTSGNGDVLTLPIAFPNAFLGGSISDGGNGIHACAITGATKSTITCYGGTYNSGTVSYSNTSYRYFVVGY